MELSSLDLMSLLERALQARAALLDPRREAALRLFNGFVEGCPGLVADLYADTLVIGNHADRPETLAGVIPAVQAALLERVPGVRTVLVKTRRSPDPQARCGVLTLGNAPARRVRENGIWYALDLQMNQDASLYLDTRLLRAWLVEHAHGWSVLNTFAYTGSLGIAAFGGGARRVVQVDLSRRFLNLAKDSCTLNGFPIQKGDFRSGDFFVEIGRMRRAGELFDCVLVDPPFFSITGRGRVDLVNEAQRVINKVRPLVRDGGYLVAINNALFLSGAEFEQTLAAICADGFLKVVERIPVPPDFTGFTETRCQQFPVDPAPYNHPTKIALLQIWRKDGASEA